MSTIVDNMSTKGFAAALFSRTRNDIFRELFRSREGLHLRELERRTGVNGRHLIRELHSLRDTGILVSKQFGNQITYRFNQNSPIYNELQSLIRKTVGLADVLRDALAPYSEQIDRAYIYGSYAQGREDADSDIDLMITGSLALREISTPLRQAEQVLQREISPVLYQAKEYAEALRDENSFVSRVHAGPRIDLIGGGS
jgi:predicted nucleotidyltransferase